MAFHGFVRFLQSIKKGIAITVGSICSTIEENLNTYRLTGGREELVQRKTYAQLLSIDDHRLPE